MAKKISIGIDLGTSYSCAAVAKDGCVEIIPDQQGNRTMPSYVAFDDSGHLIGDAAKNQVCRNPGNTIFAAKRLIGLKFSDPLVQADIKSWPFKVIAGFGDKPMIPIIAHGEVQNFSPEEILSMVFLKLREAAEAYLGTKVNDATVSVPSTFNSFQRQVIKDAATSCGLKVIRVIDQSIRSGVNYSWQRMFKDGERHVVIYDLGGGTLDVSLITDEDHNIQVRSKAGNPHLGGEDFTNRIVDFCIEDFERKNLRRKFIARNQRALCRLQAECERAKRKLSSSTEAKIEIDHLIDGIDYSCSLSRARFEELNMDYFRACLEPLERVLHDGGLDMKKTRVDVVLVGGSTRIPKVQAMIQEFFNGQALCKSLNPDEAVAIGAAVQAAFLTGDKRPRNVFVINGVPCSLGVQTVGGIMTTLIEKNTLLPTRRVLPFTTCVDKQACAVVQVFEGEGVLTKDNILIEKVLVGGISQRPLGEAKIEVRIDVEEDLKVKVHALDVTTTERKELIISYDRERLSHAENNPELYMLARRLETFEKSEFIGHSVEAHSLSSVALNGKQGKVIGSDEDHGRVFVKFPKEGKKSLKRVNLKSAQDTAAMAIAAAKATEERETSCQLGISFKFVTEVLPSEAKEMRRRLVEDVLPHKTELSEKEKKLLDNYSAAGGSPPDVKEIDFFELAQYVAYGDVAYGKGMKCPRDGQMYCSIVDGVRGRGFSKKANLFISWVWGYTFLKALLALMHFKETHTDLDTERCHFWWCFFQNNQHRLLGDMIQQSFEALKNIFSSQLRACGSMICMLNTVKDSRYALRLWCLFEVFIATEEDIPLEIMIPGSAFEELDDMVRKDGLRALAIATEVHTENAKATMPEDEANIKKLIEGMPGGYSTVNEVVSQALKKAVVKEIWR
jgi:L1 cell adhesion molecule like protein